MNYYYKISRTRSRPLFHNNRKPRENVKCEVDRATMNPVIQSESLPHLSCESVRNFSSVIFTDADASWPPTWLRTTHREQILSWKRIRRRWMLRQMTKFCASSAHHKPTSWVVGRVCLLSSTFNCTGCKWLQRSHTLCAKWKANEADQMWTFGALEWHVLLQFSSAVGTVQIALTDRFSAVRRLLFLHHLSVLLTVSAQFLDHFWTKRTHYS